MWFLQWIWPLTLTQQTLVGGVCRQEVRDRWQRRMQHTKQCWTFWHSPCVLSREPISRGRTYWEVGVSGKTAWDLGVARKSVNRKGLVTLSPQDGYWAVCLRGGSEYRACERESVLLSLKTLPQRIGIYVDYERQVSFYDTSACTHIYSFTGQCFTGSLLAYFNPDMNDSGNNNAAGYTTCQYWNGDQTYDIVTIWRMTINKIEM